ncbi:hypothetical protein M8C13_42335 [Crossiella sp. SN42]|uniref:hypothetical protein n=1 Tax=Crossiella sp. SN42 TaxID=2944808 RepID=UPI00207CB0DC|nr:hypothetical protein [Crossiella sp. SN42]MCO1582408.1 hypothetical protein [Crossiella sp. SN42]
MSEQPVSVSADDLHTYQQAAAQQAARWEEAVRRAELGETIAVIAHGEHVADVVPSGELARLRDTIAVLDRLRETLAVLSDPAARQALDDDEDVVIGADAIRALVTQRTDYEPR